MKSIVNLDAEVANGGFDFSVTEQQLDSAQVARLPVYLRNLGTPKQMSSPNARSSSPMLLIQP
jgi:hypothetical protein